MNSTLVIIMIASVIVAVFWRPILKIAVATLIIGFAFLTVTGLTDLIHGLRTLIP
jgi:hypothetical protein